MPLEQQAELAVDWFNGRRTPDANQLLKGAITGLNLGSDAPRMFRAIVECHLLRRQSHCRPLQQEGVPVNGLIGLGGVAKKSPFIMQMMADVMNMPIRIHRSEQTCALGAAMFAATAAGLYHKVEDAMAAIGQGFDATYTPDPTRTAIYAERFERYMQLGQFVESKTTDPQPAVSSTKTSVNGHKPNHQPQTAGNTGRQHHPKLN